MCGFCREYEDTYLRCPSMNEMTFSKIETGTHHKSSLAVVTRYRVFETRKVGQEENRLREICLSLSRAKLTKLSHVMLTKTILGLEQAKYRTGCALYFCNHPFLPSGAHNSTHVEHFEPAYPITLPPRSLPRKRSGVAALSNPARFVGVAFLVTRVI